MKILSLEVQGYRSLKSLTWQPGDLNVLIGPNASGKSNVLRALEMLGTMAAGGLERHIQQEGGMDAVLWDGRADELCFKVKLSPPPPYRDPATDAMTYQIRLKQLGKSSTYRIEHELLGNFTRVESGQMPEPFKFLERDPRHAVAYSMTSQRFEAPPASIPESETLLSLAAGPFTANRFIGDFQRTLARWTVYQNFQTHREAPARAPQVTRADSHVAADGQNLIAVLHNLYTSNREFEEELNAAMQAAFGDDFDKLIFPPAADQRIQMRIRWRSLRREQSTADLSDGTLRFLYLIAILANPDPPALIAIDEPEAGLHPSMLPIVAEYAREASTRCQVIFTTHSAEFLDAFGSDPPVTTVVERVDGETCLRVLQQTELVDWLSRYTLGELYRSRELEVMP